MKNKKTLLAGLVVTLLTSANLNSVNAGWSTDCTRNNSVNLQTQADITTFDKCIRGSKTTANPNYYNKVWSTNKSFCSEVLIYNQSGEPMSWLQVIAKVPNIKTLLNGEKTKGRYVISTDGNFETIYNQCYALARIMIDYYNGGKPATIKSKLDSANDLNSVVGAFSPHTVSNEIHTRKEMSEKNITIKGF
jgi:hypothetical protein